MPTSSAPYKNIVVGIDFSEYSREAVRRALAIAQPESAKVTLVHVCDMQPYVPYQSGTIKSHLDRLDKDVDAASLELMEFAKEFEESGIEFDMIVVKGKPYKELSYVTYKQNADLLIIGTRGIGRIRKLLVGSVAEKVVQLAPCSVLTVKIEGTQPFKK